MQKKANNIWKRWTFSWVGEFKEILSQSLWWGTVVNAAMLAATFYYTTLRFVAPWFTPIMFVAIAVGGLLVIYVLEKYIITPAIWAYRSKQLQQRDAEAIDKLDQLIEIETAKNEKLDKMLEQLAPSKVPNRSIAVSGGFDPVHPGHTRYIKEAMKLGSNIIVILTRDDQLAQKKGKPFMCYAERKEVLEAIVGDKGVVVPNVDIDITSVESIRKYRPETFAKGGDTWDLDNLPEAKVCGELGIDVVFGVGGFDKVQSSSRLIKGCEYDK